MRMLLPIVLLVLTACRTCPEIPDMPDAPDVVRVPVTEYVVPEWLVKPLPEDAPQANTPEEATRLACVRLGTIQVANCRAALGKQFAAGDPISADDLVACEAKAVRKCEVRP